MTVTSAFRFAPVALRIATLATALLLPVSASQAARPATPAEREAIAQVSGYPSDCMRVTVSTVDQAWAGATLTNTPGCPQGDGMGIMHLEPTGWQQIVAGSEVPPCTMVPEIPAAVGKDLRFCRNPRTFVLCANKDATSRREVSRPGRCNTLGRLDSYGESMNLARLKWRSWGQPVATARGVERGFHLPAQRIPVRVRAYRLRRYCTGDYIYTRLRATSRYGSLTVRYPTCEIDAMRRILADHWASRGARATGVAARSPGAASRGTSTRRTGADIAIHT